MFVSAAPTVRTNRLFDILRSPAKPRSHPALGYTLLI